MTLKWPPMTPNEVKDYHIDWLNLLVSGDTIDSCVWTVPSGVTKDSQSETTTVTTVWLSSPTAGATYEVPCKIVTVDGRTLERTVELPVQETIKV